MNFEQFELLLNCAVYLAMAVLLLFASRHLLRDRPSRSHRVFACGAVCLTIGVLGFSLSYLPLVAGWYSFAHFSRFIFFSLLVLSAVGGLLTVFGSLQLCALWGSTGRRVQELEELASALEREESRASGQQISNT
jgi:predicted membrane channel-forming protein YqfA (hemolysin III family)